MFNSNVLMNVYVNVHSNVLLNVCVYRSPAFFPCTCVFRENLFNALFLQIIMEASIDFAECVLTEVLTELMNGRPSSSRLADLLVHEYNVFLLHRNLCMCVWCLYNNNDAFSTIQAPYTHAQIST